GDGEVELPVGVEVRRRDGRGRTAGIGLARLERAGAAADQDDDLVVDKFVTVLGAAVISPVDTGLLGPVAGHHQVEVAVGVEVPGHQVAGRGTDPYAAGTGEGAGAGVAQDAHVRAA